MTRKHASVDIFGAVVVKYRGQGDSRAIFLLGTEYGRLLPVVRHALWRSSGFQGVALVPTLDTSFHSQREFKILSDRNALTRIQIAYLTIPKNNCVLFC